MYFLQNTDNESVKLNSRKDLRRITLEKIQDWFNAGYESIEIIDNGKIIFCFVGDGLADVIWLTCGTPNVFSERSSPQNRNLTHLLDVVNMQYGKLVDILMNSDSDACRSVKREMKASRMTLKVFAEMSSYHPEIMKLWKDFATEICNDWQFGS